MGELNPGCTNSLCGIHFAPDYFAGVPGHGIMAKQNISFLMAANHKQPGGFSVTGFRKRMSELVPEFCTSRRLLSARRRTLILKIRCVIQRNGTLKGQVVVYCFEPLITWAL